MIIDLFSRKVISWTLSSRHSVDFVKEAFLKAFSERGRPEGLLFHSDRGSEYTCKEFRDLLDQCSVLQSFSAKGYPYDNSVCESFFKYLKMEETDRKHYKNSGLIFSLISMVTTTQRGSIPLLATRHQMKLKRSSL